MELAPLAKGYTEQPSGKLSCLSCSRFRGRRVKVFQKAGGWSTKAANALIASAYLSGANTRVHRSLQAVFAGAIGKDRAVVSRTWSAAKVNGWESLTERPSDSPRDPFGQPALSSLKAELTFVKSAFAARLDSLKNILAGLPGVTLTERL